MPPSESPESKGQNYPPNRFYHFSFIFVDPRLEALLDSAGFVDLHGRAALELGMRVEVISEELEDDRVLTEVKFGLYSDGKGGDSGENCGPPTAMLYDWLRRHEVVEIELIQATVHSRGEGELHPGESQDITSEVRILSAPGAVPDWDRVKFDEPN